MTTPRQHPFANVVSFKPQPTFYFPVVRDVGNSSWVAVHPLGEDCPFTQLAKKFGVVAKDSRLYLRQHTAEEADALARHIEETIDRDRLHKVSKP
jgi:hypothetical protein